MRIAVIIQLFSFTRRYEQRMYLLDSATTLVSLILVVSLCIVCRLFIVNYVLASEISVFRNSAATSQTLVNLVISTSPYTNAAKHSINEIICLCHMHTRRQSILSTLTAFYFSFHNNGIVVVARSYLVFSSSPPKTSKLLLHLHYK